MGEPDASDFMTAQEVARKLRFTSRGVTKLANAGAIPGATKIAGRWRFDRYMLAGYIKAGERKRSQWHPSTKGAVNIGAAFNAAVVSSDGRLERLLNLRPKSDSPHGSKS